MNNSTISQTKRRPVKSCGSFHVRRRTNAALGLLTGFLCAISSVTSTSGEKLNLFMVGNSYTQFNDLELMVKSLLEEGLAGSDEDYDHDYVNAKRYAKDGAAFRDFVDNEAFRNTLAEKPWDWVVLQEQSLTPGLWESEAGDIFDDSLESMVKLSDMINRTDADTVLLMTWGRLSGDEIYFPELYPDFTTMQDRLVEGYHRYRDAVTSKERPVKIAPAGLAFKAVHDAVNDQGFDPKEPGTQFSSLYQQDGGHPTPKGSYLAACVLYATMTGRDPKGLKWAPNGVDDVSRNFLQRVASATVANYDKETLLSAAIPIPDVPTKTKATTMVRTNTVVSSHSPYFLIPASFFCCFFILVLLLPFLRKNNSAPTIF